MLKFFLEVIVFVLAYPEAFDCVVYLDGYSNKYIVSGGTLAWRINNPGLVRSHSRVSKKNGAIGSYGPYSIFLTPEDGFDALHDWLSLKSHYRWNIKAIAKCYKPNDSKKFLEKLMEFGDFSGTRKLKSLSNNDGVILAFVMGSSLRLCVLMMGFSYT